MKKINKIKDKDVEISEDLLFAIEKKLLKLRQKEIRAFQFYKRNPLKFLFIDFLEGTIKGIGFFFGATVVVAILTILVTQYFSTLPYVGNFFEQFGKLLDEQTNVESVNIDS